MVCWSTHTVLFGLYRHCTARIGVVIRSYYNNGSKNIVGSNFVLPDALELREDAHSKALHWFWVNLRGTRR